VAVAGLVVRDHTGAFVDVASRRYIHIVEPFTVELIASQGSWTDSQVDNATKGILEFN
jgi:hypothetical protein